MSRMRADEWVAFTEIVRSPPVPELRLLAMIRLLLCQIKMQALVSGAWRVQIVEAVMSNDRG